jgi:hypothetical protein
MADAVPDTESVLGFVNRHYAGLKPQAEKDNNSANGNITRVIGLIHGLFETINKPDATHDTIAGQLKAFYTAYEDLKLSDTDAATYTRYKDAFGSLNTIVDGLEEVEAGVGGKEADAGREEAKKGAESKGVGGETGETEEEEGIDAG